MRFSAASIFIRSCLALAPLSLFLAASCRGADPVVSNVRAMVVADDGKTSSGRYLVKRDPLGAASGSFRVLRGGYWDNYVQYCRSAYRGNVNPSGRNYCIGFRAAMTLP